MLYLTSCGCKMVLSIYEAFYQMFLYPLYETQVSQIGIVYNFDPRARAFRTDRLGESQYTLEQSVDCNKLLTGLTDRYYSICILYYRYRRSVLR